MTIDITRRTVRMRWISSPVIRPFIVMSVLLRMNRPTMIGISSGRAVLSCLRWTSTPQRLTSPGVIMSIIRTNEMGGLSRASLLSCWSQMILRGLRKVRVLRCLNGARTIGQLSHAVGLGMIFRLKLRTRMARMNGLRRMIIVGRRRRRMSIQLWLGHDLRKGGGHGRGSHGSKHAERSGNMRVVGLMSYRLCPWTANTLKGPWGAQWLLMIILGLMF
jgi:hypothetical protein